MNEYGVEITDVKQIPVHVNTWINKLKNIAMYNIRDIDIGYRFDKDKDIGYIGRNLNRLSMYMIDYFTTRPEIIIDYGLILTNRIGNAIIAIKKLNELALLTIPAKQLKIEAYSLMYGLIDNLIDIRELSKKLK